MYGDADRVQFQGKPVASALKRSELHFELCQAQLTLSIANRGTKDTYVAKDLKNPARPISRADWPFGPSESSCSIPPHV
ncbi:unnamed protein product [Nesidiocoris tenuis]|uniref:Uncharacterized protein n=1 Tax=Nesidiocoris tenuis TaxID=355587 RepID=A0A6H5GL41_9HEMI|nr:unnamed protein product [Nesidiocoris tenuis]